MLAGVRFPCAIILVAACSAGPDVEGPRAKPVLRLVECMPAQPLFVEVDGRVTTHGRLDGEGMGWAGGKPAAKRAASVTMGVPQTSAMMDAMVVRKAVTAKLPDLQRCYERELATNAATTRHSVAWRFSIAQDGRVLFANPTTNAMSTATSSCVTAVFRTLTFPGRPAGGTVSVTLPLVFDSIPISDRPAPLAGADGSKVAWTPFAMGAFAPDRAVIVARAAQSVLRHRAGKLDACFGANASGSLRAVLGVEADGDVAITRAGGLGDPAIEQCFEKELAGAKLVNPLRDPTEITCDFARGDAQPWRVSPAAGYAVITATRKELRFGTTTLTIGAIEPDPLPAGATYLIVVEPDVQGAMLSNALAWASEGDATLVALRDGGRSPMYLGMARTGHDDALSTRPILRLGRGTVQACLGRQMREGKLADAGTLALRLAKRCREARCGSVVVGIDDLATARDLVEVTGAARRAGFERVLIGGHVGCEQHEDLEDDEP